jgi:hypothetical protein
MKKTDLKVGSTYRGKKNPKITRKIISKKYNEYLNCDKYTYTSSKFKGQHTCADWNFAAWADSEVKE